MGLVWLTPVIAGRPLLIACLSDVRAVDRQAMRTKTGIPARD
jgi:hypothetical protein